MPEAVRYRGTGAHPGLRNVARNPARMHHQRKYEDIVDREKDRTTIEETFRRLVVLVNGLRRGAATGNARES